MNAKPAKIALLLAGGGARAAYQVGVLRSIARAFPQLEFTILTGVSAGALNAAVMANAPLDLPETVELLASHWESLTLERVFRSDFRALGSNIARWVFRVFSGGAHLLPPLRGLVDTGPLRELAHAMFETTDGVLHGVGENIRTGRIHAVGITTTRYPTAENVTWVQGKEVTPWNSPGRSGVPTQLTVEHIMASCALPLVFPASKLENSWHGDGGIRMTAPLSPAVQLGADRIIAISTLLEPGRSEATRPSDEYPPPATVLSVMLDSVFLDMLDVDAMELRRMNRLIAAHPRSTEMGLRPVDAHIIRPSQDLGVIASEFEEELPRALRHLIRGLGSGETNRSDIIATLLFQPLFIRKMIEIGEHDGEKQIAELASFLGCPAVPPIQRLTVEVQPLAANAPLPVRAAA